MRNMVYGRRPENIFQHSEIYLQSEIEFLKIVKLLPTPRFQIPLKTQTCIKIIFLFIHKRIVLLPT